MEDNKSKDSHSTPANLSTGQTFNTQPANKNFPPVLVAFQEPSLNRMRNQHKKEKKYF